MIIILFIAILGILILVHELGHFLAAKKMGIRVDEFGIGFPPKIFSFKKGETVYSINLIPLGGFVKIFGEDPDEESMSGEDSARSMINKPRWVQAIVISSGVFFNIIFAWILISIGFMVGFPMSADQFAAKDVRDSNVVIVDVLENSPASEGGLEVGDKLLSLSVGEESIEKFDEKQMQLFIASHGNEEMDILYQRGKNKVLNIVIVPEEGVIIEGVPAIGVATDVVGIVKLSPYRSIWEGLKLTINLIVSTFVGLALFIVSLIKGTGNFTQISGPVGIIGMVGTAAEFGFIYLLSFTAFISINLAVINFIPFPALDGGRLLFILIESIIRKNIKPAISNSLNFIGFVLLITLMVVVTYSDILKLF